MGERINDQRATEGGNTMSEQEVATDHLGEFLAGQFGSMAEREDRMRKENQQLRALVTRLTDVAENLASGLPDPGTEALAAIHCGRNFIYG